METELIYAWLEIPPGSWPPDHYTLLGLPPDLFDSAQIEGRVQERMQRVRHFQLTHPELATEAMNRLAQALLCLTNPAEREKYNQQLQGGGAGLVVAKVAQPRAQSEAEILPVGVIVSRFDAESSTPVQHAEKPAIPQVSKSPPTPPTERKPLLETIALARRLVSEWQFVGGQVLAPSRTEVEAIELRRLRRRLNALSDDLKAAGIPLGQPDQPGFKLLSLGHSHSGLADLGMMDQPSLANDWNVGLEWLRDWRRLLKAEVARQRRRAWPRRWLRKLGRFYLRHPGPFLFLLGWLSLDLASPRLRELWRGQLVVLGILLTLATSFWSWKWSKLKSTN